jgi:hypothetical protein
MPITYHLGTDETDVCAYDSDKDTTWVVCSTNISADRPYEQRIADAAYIRRLLDVPAGYVLVQVPVEATIPVYSPGSDDTQVWIDEPGVLMRELK